MNAANFHSLRKIEATDVTLCTFNDVYTCIKLLPLLRICSQVTISKRQINTEIHVCQVKSFLGLREKKNRPYPIFSLIYLEY